MLGGRFSMLGRRVFRCSPEGDGCRRTWIDAGGPFTLLCFVVVRHLSLSAGSFSLFAGTHTLVLAILRVPPARDGLYFYPSFLHVL